MIDQVPEVLWVADAVIISHLKEEVLSQQTQLEHIQKYNSDCFFLSLAQHEEKERWYEA